MVSCHHHLSVRGQRGALRFDVSLDLTASWTVLFGPSGSGKSTLLRAACGLTPDLEVAFTRHISESSASEDLAALPIHRRDLAYAPQGAEAFPHLTVHQNVAFPSSARSAEDHVLVDEALSFFLLGGLRQRRSSQLSGGERQRVSLARALAVPDAKLMLFDEPFNGLDRSLRDDLLLRMRERTAELGIPVLSVTHDVEEALLLEAEVIRIANARILTRGPARIALADEYTRIRTLLDQVPPPYPPPYFRG